VQTRTLNAERRRLDDLLHKVFERLASGELEPETASAVLWQKVPDPLPGWPPPDQTLQHVIDKDVTRAVAGVRHATAEAGRTHFDTGLSAYPLAAVDFDTHGPKAPAFAPLLFFCLDHTILEGMAWYMGMAHSALSRKRETAPADLYPGDEAIALMERANTFLEIEVTLWTAAQAGGFDGAVPYAVRYESARYLWSPTIAGTAFCLRCGEVIRYQRRGRQSGKEARTVPVCSRCIRAENLNWPTNAVMPDTRRTWWLRCVTCDVVFKGGGNREYCDKHRRAPKQC
jgi:hypothetical protein